MNKHLNFIVLGVILVVGEGRVGEASRALPPLPDDVVQKHILKHLDPISLGQFRMTSKAGQALVDTFSPDEEYLERYSLKELSLSGKEDFRRVSSYLPLLRSKGENLVLSAGNETDPPHLISSWPPKLQDVLNLFPNLHKLQIDFPLMKDDVLALSGYLVQHPTFKTLYIKIREMDEEVDRAFGAALHSVQNWQWLGIHIHNQTQRTVTRDAYKNIECKFAKTIGFYNFDNGPRFW